MSSFRAFAVPLSTDRYPLRRPIAHPRPTKKPPKLDPGGKPRPAVLFRDPATKQHGGNPVAVACCLCAGRPRIICRRAPRSRATSTTCRRLRARKERHHGETRPAERGGSDESRSGSRVLQRAGVCGSVIGGDGRHRRRLCRGRPVSAAGTQCRRDRSSDRNPLVRGRRMQAPTRTRGADTLAKRPFRSRRPTARGRCGATSGRSGRPTPGRRRRPPAPERARLRTGSGGARQLEPPLAGPTGGQSSSDSMRGPASGSAGQAPGLRVPRRAQPESGPRV